MNTPLLIIVGVVVVWALFILYTHHAATASEGKSVSLLCRLFPELEGCKKTVLVYCFSPRCSPCRQMTPVIEELKRDTGRAFVLDVSKHMELAHEMGIRATPTVLLIREGRVEKSIIGTKNRKYLLALLEA